MNIFSNHIQYSFLLLLYPVLSLAGLYNWLQKNCYHLSVYLLVFGSEEFHIYTHHLSTTVMNREYHWGCPSRKFPGHPLKTGFAQILEGFHLAHRTIMYPSSFLIQTPMPSEISLKAQVAAQHQLVKSRYPIVLLYFNSCICSCRSQAARSSVSQ